MSEFDDINNLPEAKPEDKNVRTDEMNAINENRKLKSSDLLTAITKQMQQSAKKIALNDFNESLKVNLETHSQTTGEPNKTKQATNKEEIKRPSTDDGHEL